MSPDVSSIGGADSQHLTLSLIVLMLLHPPVQMSIVTGLVKLAHDIAECLLLYKEILTLLHVEVGTFQEVPESIIRIIPIELFNILFLLSCCRIVSVYARRYDIEYTFTGIEDLNLREILLFWLWIEHHTIFFPLLLTVHSYDTLM